MVGIEVSGEGPHEFPAEGPFTADEGVAWLALLSSLDSRGLSGVRLVGSDADVGFKAAATSVVTARRWKRRHTHLATNALTRVPKAAYAGVAAVSRISFLQQDADPVRQHVENVLAVHEEYLPDARKVLLDALEDALVFTVLAKERWHRVRSNDP